MNQWWNPTHAYTLNPMPMQHRLRFAGRTIAGTVSDGYEFKDDKLEVV